MLCANCQTELLKNESEFGTYYECPNCPGILISFYTLKISRINQLFLKEKLRAAKKDISISGISCPSCEHDLSRQDDVSGANMMFCRNCDMIWTDQESFDKFPKSDKPVVKDKISTVKKSLSEEEKEDLIIAMAAEQSSLYTRNSSSFLGNIEGPKDIVAGLFSLPIEEDGKFFDYYSLITWAMVGLFLLLFIVTRFDLRNSMMLLGYIPDQWSRGFGLPVLSSFAMHADFWHFFSNSYFLMLFGDNVENAIGRVKYLILVLISHISGLLLHTFLDPNGHIPLVGASAGISGVIAFYCLVYPKKKIGWVLRFWFYFYKIKLPAWSFLAIWLLIQFIIAKLQISGGSSVSALGHLGGVFIGVIAAFLYKRNDWNWNKESAL